jgi:hypothetical protein
VRSLRFSGGVRKMKSLFSVLWHQKSGDTVAEIVSMLRWDLYLSPYLNWLNSCNVFIASNKNTITGYDLEETRKRLRVFHLFL